jgi:hypothetical protein
MTKQDIYYDVGYLVTVLFAFAIGYMMGAMY